MTTSTAQAQASRANGTANARSNDAGPNGAAANPPAYGIDFLDQPRGQPNRTDLPEHLRAGVENLSGMSMDNVRVHYNSPKPAQLQALAYTRGTDIHVAPGQERHLAHEAWHVVQQAQGRVKPTVQMRQGIAVNDDAGLERGADDMGMRTASALERQPRRDTVNGSVAAPLHKQNGDGSSSIPIQRLGSILGSAYYLGKSLTVDMPMHVWRLIKHCTIGLGVSAATILYHFGKALYEGFANGNWSEFAINMAKALIGDPLFWALKLLAKVLDLLAFGEAMDLIMAIVKYNTRKMTLAEINAYRKVFGNTINYDQVRVDEHSLLNTHVFRFWIAFTTWHTVNWPNGSSFQTDPGTFIHEMAHIWQMERRGTQYIAEAPYGGGLNGNGYVYAFDRNFANAANGAKLTTARGKGKTIWSYNLEQQAEICRHYYLRHIRRLPTSDWQPYINDIQEKNTMPLKNWIQQPAFLPHS